MSGWAVEDIARRIAQDIPDGSYVNLGIGNPELVARFVPSDRTIIYHTENGLLGMGPPTDDGDPELINAGKKRVSAVPGASYFHHADSFAMIRGGHIDICVLGGLQVSAAGDLANWSTGAADAIPAVGGAMDLVSGAKRIFVIMQHTTKEGAPKVLKTCTYPLTGAGVVERLYTNLAVMAVTPAGLQVEALAPGVSFEHLQQQTATELTMAPSPPS